MKNKVSEFKENILDKYRSKIRERAIIQAKKRIALSDKKINDFTQDELEVIVLNEEEKLKRALRQSGVVALLITLGLN
ncbi:unnamed protein product [marine sediment metagenome]|uniref:Uncharacterized protein n=1 Tax=marine sediment metagenome TaxID=412755 RepID=X1CDL9_9ZZZZ